MDDRCFFIQSEVDCQILDDWAICQRHEFARHLAYIGYDWILH